MQSEIQESEKSGEMLSNATLAQLQAGKLSIISNVLSRSVDKQRDELLQPQVALLGQEASHVCLYKGPKIASTAVRLR